MLCVCLFFFFFKQKTAYEMRISDWSSDVCSSDLTPTFEALQQKADEAMFERRALAVDKERAIAENELGNKTELARREKQLIAEEAENARNRATGLAEAQQVEAEAEAGRIRKIGRAHV